MRVPASRRPPDARDLPLELDAAGRQYAGAYELAKLFEIGGGGAAAVDEEIGVELGDLGVTVDEAATAGAVDELPGLCAGAGS